MADNAPTTGAVNAATFDVAAWLSRFESVGGSYLATDSQTSFCLACENMGSGRKSPALALLNSLTDDQRADVVSHIRAQSGFLPIPQKTLDQPDLKAIPLENLGEPAGISAASGGSSLDHESEGSDKMDMTHAFKPEAATQHPMDWDSKLAAVLGLSGPSTTKPSCSNDSARTSPTEWGAAVARWKEAIEALHAWRGPEDLPEDLCDAETAAWRAMLNCPAPDLAALQFKLQHLLNIETAIDVTNAWNGSEVRQTLADIERLMAGAPPSRPNAELNLARHADWDSAMKAFTAAEAAEALYDRDKWGPAYEVEKAGGAKIPEAIGDEMELLGDACSDRRWELIDMPAPHVGALRWKLDYILADDGGDSLRPYAHSALRQMFEDIDRFLPKTPAQTGYATEPAVDTEILAAWDKRQAAHTLYNSLPMDGGGTVDGMTPEERRCREIIDDAEETILDAVAQTREGAAIQLKIAMYYFMDKKADEEALTRGDLAYLEEHASLEWGGRAVLAALRSLEGQSGIPAASGHQLAA